MVIKQFANGVKFWYLLATNRFKLETVIYGVECGLFDGVVNKLAEGIECGSLGHIYLNWVINNI